MLNANISMSAGGKHDKLYIFGHLMTSGFRWWYGFFNSITTKKIYQEKKKKSDFILG